MTASALIPNIIPALAEVLMVVGTCVLLTFGLIRRATEALVPLLSLVLLVLILFVLFFSKTAETTTFNGLFIHDAFASFFKILLVGMSLFVLVVSRKTVFIENLNYFEYPILILFSLLGMMIMVSANDLLALFMGLELQSLSLYILTAIRRDDSLASEAGIKYFVLGALSTGMLLFGISFIYGFTGTTAFPSLALATPSLGLWVGFLFLLVGMAFKISAAPFHMWTPDVYEGTPTSVTLFLAAVPKLAAFGLLIRLLMGPFYSFVIQWSDVLSVFAIISMLWGALAALNQQNVKRLLAYSAVGNMGYALIGLVGGSPAGIQATLIYLGLYAVMILGIFGCLLNLLCYGQPAEKIQDLRGLMQVYPRIAFIMIFLLFSMAGIPPSAGFLGKLYIFQTAVFQGYYFLAIAGILTSVLAAAYYLYLIKVIVMDNPSALRSTSPYPLRRDVFVNVILGGIVAGLLWFFIHPTSVITWAAKAVSIFA